MSPSLTLSLALLFTPLPAPPSPPGTPSSPPAVSDHAGRSWAVVHAGQGWVCWQPDPDCWRRIELEREGRAGPELDEPLEDLLEEPDETALDNPVRDHGAEHWRLGFSADASALWIEIDDRRWRLDRGHRVASRVDTQAPTRLLRPHRSSCSASGWLPVVLAGRLDWGEAPSCVVPPPTFSCVGSDRPHLHLRPALPVRVRAGIELASFGGWTSSDETLDAAAPGVTRLRRQAGFEVMVFVELGFASSWASAREREQLALLSRSRLRRLPPIMPGPLATREREAQAAVLCGGAP